MNDCGRTIYHRSFSFVGHDEDFKTLSPSGSVFNSSQIIDGILADE